MKLMDIYAFDGRNIHSHKPVIEMYVMLDNASSNTREIPGFKDRLLEYLPGLKDHYCSLGRPGGFVERVDEGTMLGHVVEHVALELNTLIDAPVYYGKTRSTNTNRVYQVVFEYRAKQTALFLGRVAVELVDALVRGRTFPLDKRLEEAKTLHAATQLGPSTRAIIEAAQDRDIPVIRLNEGSLFQLGYGKHQRRIQATITDSCSSISVDIAGDKLLAKKLLADSGIPVPRGGVARTEKEALKIAGELGCVAVKPAFGNQGKGVTLNLKDRKEIRLAFRLARSYSDLIIVEQFIPGNHYRVLVVGGRVVAAAQRFPASVVGDGRHTIKELIDIANADPRRGEDHEKPLTKIRVDPVVLMVLARLNLTLESVPSLGEQVFLRDNANLSTGGYAVDVTDEIHPDNMSLCVRAAQVLGLDVAGIDIVTRHISVPICSSGGVVIEVNAAPGIRMHLYPSQGKPRDVGAAIVQHMFPQGSKSRIPIVSITGTNGKTTTARLVAHFLNLWGLKVGLTCTDGVYIDNERIVTGDTTGAWSARLVLMDPTVEAAVLETARGGIIKTGLAYDQADVGVITNITGDHLGLDGIDSIEEMAWVKSQVVEAVRDDGHAVLNADDPMSTSVVERVRCRLIPFSTKEDNLLVRKHIQRGGKAVYIKNGSMVVSEKDKEWTVLSLRDIPFTLQGKAIHNVENALAATAAAVGLGVPAYVIRRGLSSFACNDRLNPGRFNLHAVSNFRVLVDYGHNPAALDSVLSTARQMTPSKLIGVVTTPGDRRDADIKAVGAVAAKYCDIIILKEDKDLRGRQPGEIARLMAEGVETAKFPAERVHIVLKEREAMLKGLQMAKKGDLVVVFYEKYQVVMDAIREFTEMLNTGSESVLRGSGG
ncbi:MAG: cyanophycin synthetase [Bacillota bacterium]